MRSNPPMVKLAVVLAVTAIAFLFVPVARCGTKYKILHSFGGGKDGVGVPSGPLLLDQNGNLFGNTYGITFELMQEKSGEWKEAIIHTFASGDGSAWGPLIADQAGNIYGTTQGGPASKSVAFELARGAAGWNFSVLYDHGAGPGLLLDMAGNLYGEIGPGDYFGIGAIGELSPGSSGWTYIQLYSFCSQHACADGDSPLAPPIWDRHGNLFGTTYNGGIGQPSCPSTFGCGVIFKMTRNRDGSWAYHVLHRFASFPHDGQSPAAGLVMDASGNLYGDTEAGGPSGNGTIFKLTLVGGRWKKTLVHDFPSCVNGCGPKGTLVFDKMGNLYGAANGGLADCGGFACGLIFKLTPQKNGKWTYRVLHKLNGQDGLFPWGVIVDGKGNIFGTTFGGGKYNAGVAFEITP